MNRVSPGSPAPVGEPAPVPKPKISLASKLRVFVSKLSGKNVKWAKSLPADRPVVKRLPLGKRPGGARYAGLVLSTKPFAFILERKDAMGQVRYAGPFGVKKPEPSLGTRTWATGANQDCQDDILTTTKYASGNGHPRRLNRGEDLDEVSVTRSGALLRAAQEAEDTGVR